MNKKLRVTILVVAFLSITTLMIGLNSRAFVPRAATPTATTPPGPLMPGGSTVNIPPGSSVWIAPNNWDTTFAGNLQDRMSFEGLFASPYNLTMATSSSTATFWLVGGVDEIYIPDEWKVGTLYVVSPSTKQILNSYTSRAAGTYDELYVARKLAQNGLKPDIHN
jgi:hypothetical protein